MNQWQFPGARWWKFDFHTHTPASDDFMKGCKLQDKDEVTPEFWLRKFMEKEIDCVAITDHNSGTWIDKLKLALARLDKTKPDWYRPLHLFPGVEISVQGGVHLLAVFSSQKSTSDIDSLLGSVGYRGTKGASDDVTTQSLTVVVDLIVNAEGIAIPAHVDKEKGLFGLQGNTLRQALDDENIYAMELCDSGYQKPQLYINKKLQWTEVKGSDTHNFMSDAFGVFTWIKMDEPSIEGLKLALIDGAVSVNRDMNDKPNRHAKKYFIEELIVKEAKYMGRSGQLNCRFSPFLNTIIGGRGSGKSTLLEFMRFVLRRDKEIPKSLIEESKKYFNVGGDNLLLDTSCLSLIYRKGETRYRLNWSTKADSASLEAEIDNSWKAESGDIRSLFPVYIYSQKQIFTLAQKPDALLDIVDKDPSVEYASLEQNRTRSVNRYKHLEQQAKELEEKIAQKDTLTGLLNDVSRQIGQIEKSGHKNVLQSYRQRRRQLSVMDNLEEHWGQMAFRLREAQEEIAPMPFDEQVFSNHKDILQAITDTNDKWKTINGQLGKLIKESQSIVSVWQQTKAGAEWMKNLKVDVEQYEQLRTQLEQQGIDPEKYPQLLQQQTQYQKELKQIDGYVESLERLVRDKQQVLEEIKQIREQLTEKRISFLASVLMGNQSVDIKVKPFGQRWKEVAGDIRQTLQCETRFDGDFDELKKVYENGDKNVAIQDIKNKLINIRSGNDSAKDRRFATHVRRLPQESISELLCWFPQDALEIITFGDQGKEQNIQQGSPGQKTAALLTFILSYGEEPLLLDQPEDDLDNELIYGLIVKQLRETKSKRQIIVVTHNANIVVNGDAEMVLPLTVKNGQSFVESPASIQNNHTREKICNILEGGQQAFEQRYKRIHLEHSNV